METTPYFERSRLRPGHVSKMVALKALAHEVERQVQPNGRI